MPRSPAPTSRRAAPAARAVLHALLARRDPGHHAAQLRADLLDRVLRRVVAHLVEVRTTVLVLGDPFLRERPRFELAEDLLHLVLGSRRDDARTARHLAVLRGV